jgi:hypothetical protein
MMVTPLIRILIAAMFVAAIGVFGSACTFEDGNPWATAKGSVSTSFDVPSDRVADDGAIKTANDFLISLDSLVVEIEPIELIQSAVAAEVDFDPANPPEGYSLCHNGHCHADSGELVDYDEIIAELGDDAGGGTRTLVLSNTSADIRSAPLVVSFDDCPSAGCPLGPAPLTGMGIGIVQIQMNASVADARSGETQRVEPFELELSVEITASLRANMNEEISYHGENELEIDAQLAIPGRVLDSIDWSTLAEPLSDTTRNQIADQLASALEEDASLIVDVHRHDL